MDALKRALIISYMCAVFFFGLWWSKDYGDCHRMAWPSLAISGELFVWYQAVLWPFTIWVPFFERERNHRLFCATGGWTGRP